LTIRRKIENGRYYCAFGRSKAHHESRHHVVLNPHDPVIIFGEHPPMGIMAVELNAVARKRSNATMPVS
jgi:hypothetical protein